MLVAAQSVQKRTMPHNPKVPGGMVNHELISEYKATGVEAGVDLRGEAFLAEIRRRDLDL